jgi:hypothetical protein
MSTQRGLDAETIKALEAPMESLTVDGMIRRLDSVLEKAWSFQFQGPEIVDVPTKVAKYKTAKNPQAFVQKNVPHFQCSCQIILHVPGLDSMIREYSVLIPVEEGSFGVARDLALIYAAHKGWGVGRQSADIFTAEDNLVQVEVGLEPSEVEKRLKEIEEIKLKLGLKHHHELASYVLEWSDGELSSILSITRQNIGEFTDFLQTKVKALTQ